MSSHRETCRCAKCRSKWKKDLLAHMERDLAGIRAMKDVMEKAKQAVDERHALMESAEANKDERTSG